jgi:electron transfer flavoprotein alpha subunit
MKILLVAEYRQGKVVESYQELIAFGQNFGAESAMFLVGDGAGSLPKFQGRLYLAEASQYGEYNPDAH